jgi:predicted amidophosphoribosyltransferase
MVAALKYRSADRLAVTMASQIVAGTPPEVLAGGTLVPVPVGRARRRRRGFNQAELIADALGVRTGLGICDCLERVETAGTQVGRGRDQRRRAAASSIRPRPGAPLPAKVVLVDDVVTTGATLTACANALRTAGVRVRCSVAYARTPGR